MTTRMQEALERLESNDLLQLGMDADAARANLWPERIVTYMVGQVLTAGGTGDLIGEAEAAVARGARGFILRPSPGATLENLERAITALARRFPEIPLTGHFTEEIAQFAADRKLADILKRLRDAGLVALDDRAAGNPRSASWLTFHRQAHRLGLPSIATIVLRSDETSGQWIDRLESLASLQAETHGILACEPRMERMPRALDEVTGARYLQFVALARLYLPEVPHIQADWSVLGPKVLQLALRFGADDAGLVPAAPRDPKLPSHHSGEEELRRIIRDAGFAPVERDAVYRRQFVS